LIASCDTHIPLPRLPAGVALVRHGSRVTTQPLSLRAGDRLRVARPAGFTFSYAGNSYRVAHARLRLRCAAVELEHSRATVLAVDLVSGVVRVRAGGHATRALVLSREMLAFARLPGTRYVAERDAAAKRTSSWTLDQPIVAARNSDQALRIDTRISYTAISDADGLRLDIWPFSISRLQRPVRAADRLVPYWADGLPCSVGCTAAGAVPGWPLKPFHRQHAIRAGINELRPANFHVGVDIEAKDGEPVYALQSGVAHIRYPRTPDVNVDVGRFYYWHIDPAVGEGQHVVAYRTVLGRVLYGFKHVALSEGTTADYLNPLRPGGSLRPYRDTEPPIIGTPHLFADGRVIVGAFDPQSLVEKASYETPVLAPSSLAWRLYDARGRPLTGLEWAMRGSQNYPSSLKRVVFAPGASNPGFACFFHRQRCIPNWVYWLAGGLTPALPLGSLAPGRYRLTVYAWDWAGNTSALDYPFTLPLAHASAAAPAIPEFGPLAANFDYP
jgi:hypothetical protein